MKIQPFTRQSFEIPVEDHDLSTGFYFEIHLIQLDSTVTRRPVTVTLSSLEDDITVTPVGSGCKLSCVLGPEKTAPFKGKRFPIHQDPDNHCWAQVHYINSDSSVVGMTDPVVVEVGDVIHPGLIEYKENAEEEVEANG